MMRPMVTTFDTYHKIFKPIIVFDMVHMMDTFIGSKLSPKVFFHKDSMLSEVFTFNENNDIAVRTSGSSAFPSFAGRTLGGCISIVMWVTFNRAVFFGRKVFSAFSRFFGNFFTTSLTGFHRGIISQSCVFVNGGV